MKKSKQNIVKKLGKKILSLLYLVLKPFVPYIIVFIFIFFFIILIIDAIFVSFSDENGELTINESEIESYCEDIGESNYDVYLDGKKTNENIKVASEETAKAITWEQIYTLLLFQNITNDKEITKELAYEVANEFKSKYYYKTSTILTEKKVIDDNGNVKWEKVNEETIRLITESITISGHYKYSYTKETVEKRRYKNNKGGVKEYSFSKRGV